MRKITSWIVMIFVVLSQLIPAAEVILAEDNQAFFTINETYNRDNNASNLELRKNKEIDVDRVEITFAKSIEYFANLSTIHHATTTVNTAQNKLILTDLGESFGEFNLWVKSVSNESANILVEGFKDNQKIKSQNYLLVNREQNKEAVNQSVEKAAVISEERTAIQPRVGDLNTDISLKALSKSVLAGRDASYKLSFKLTGSKQEYKNARLIIDLPITTYTELNQNLEELAIKKVTPTYNSEKSQLIYEFKDQLVSGETYERVIKIETKNLISPNDSILEMKASLIFNQNSESQETSFSDQDSVKVKSSEEIVVTKKFIEAKKDGKSTLTPKPGSETIWQIKVNVPKNESGSTGLDPKKSIIVEDVFSDELSYVSVINNTPKPKKTEKNKVIWEFTPPTIEEQFKMKDNLFTVDLWVKLKVPDKKTMIGQNVHNIATAEAQFMNHVNPLKTSTKKIEVGVYDSEGNTDDIEGAIMAPVHIGPSDGKTGIGKGDSKNPNPQVGQKDDGHLKFVHGISSMKIGAIYDMKNYTSIYTIDDNLELEKIHTPGRWVFARNNDELKMNKPLENNPEFDIILELKNGTIKEIKNAEADKIYTRKDLNLQMTDHVKTIKYYYHYAPAGMHARQRADYYFYPRKNYVGEVKNSYNVYVEPDELAIKDWNKDAAGNSPNNSPIADKGWWYMKNMENIWKRMASDRTAQVLPKLENQPPIASIGVELVEQSNGYVTLGKNRMRVEFKNEPSSTTSISYPVEAYALLPIGVQLANEANATFSTNDILNSQGSYKIVDKNYKNSGKQLVKITWDDLRVRIGEKFSAELDVNLSQSMSNALQFKVFGFSGEKNITAPVTNSPTITSTILEKDLEDINQDKNTEQYRLQSGNEYLIFGQYDLQSEKFIKKADATEWSKAIQKVLPGEKIDYQLVMTNQTSHTFESMILMDVLPSVGDFGLTDNINRGSHFTPYLTGPISLPSEWQDKVDVFYSQSKNPKRMN